MLKEISRSKALCLVAIVVVVLTCVGSTQLDGPDCKKKGKSLASLMVAREAIVKAKELYPNCTDSRVNSSKSGCETEGKSFGYLDVTLNLISYALENYPKCDDIEKEKPDPAIKNKTLKYDHPMDCSQVLENGHNASGVYSIWLKGTSTKKRVEVYCDMNTAGGGWTVIQKRGNFSTQEDFYQDWVTYKNGFGNKSQEFWLGNDNIFLLTNQATYSIRFDLEDSSGNKGHALYKTFRIENGTENYKLNITGYSGDIGDSMTANHNLKRFSTLDKKNENGCGTQDCSTQFKGGWWYGESSMYCCYGANLNGLYKKGSGDKGVTWVKWRSYEALKSAEMKLKRL